MGRNSLKKGAVGLIPATRGGVYSKPTSSKVQSAGEREDDEEEKARAGEATRGADGPGGTLRPP